MTDKTPCENDAFDLKPLPFHHRPQDGRAERLAQQPAARDSAFGQSLLDSLGVIFQRPRQSPWVGNLHKAQPAAQGGAEAAYQRPVPVQPWQINEGGRRSSLMD